MTRTALSSARQKTVRRMRYSVKKKRFTNDNNNNTNACINAEEIIITISKSIVGSTHYITLLKENPMPFDKGAESMKGTSTTETEDRIRHWADKGYQAMAKDLPGTTTTTTTTTTMIPYKRSKNTPR